ncbi:MAG TPA: TIGR03663 family protein, partial [Vicinamibacterales bacterium]|nr:TIGR03663 family protein [Vicinamibacterales bacterium]
RAPARVSGAVTAALALALAFRLAGAAARPMHHDEANQAVKFGELLETGDYRYDRNDHHGPTLYYLTLPAAWARGQATLASLDERTLRAVPALFGAGLILLLVPLARGLGRPAAAAAAMLAAVSPLLVYYSRFYIQESLFACFSLACLAAVGRFAERPSRAAALCAGWCAGLAYATKETSILLLPAVAAAALLARGSAERDGSVQPAPAGDRRARRSAAALGLAAAVATAFVFYSSICKYPGGLLESVRSFGIYAARGAGAGPHAQPFGYYARMLAFSSSGGLVWSEGLILGLAAAGMIASSRRTPGAGAGFWPRYVALYSLIAFLAFSAVPYKTPWNAVPFHTGFVIMAGVGAAAVLEWLRSRLLKAVALLALAAAAAQLGVQSWRASFPYSADPRNPYVYAHTVPDFLRLVQRVRDVAARSPDGMRTPVKVVAGPYEQWPLPWYLRGMTRVGYWTRAADADPLDEAPLIVASQEHAGEVGAALGDRYVQEFYGLRPEVVLTLFVERSAWDRLIAARAAAP